MELHYWELDHTLHCVDLSAIPSGWSRHYWGWGQGTIIVQIVWPITMGVPSATGASQYGGGHGSTISRALLHVSYF